MRFVADTHALLWWFIDSPKISPTVSKIFESCEKGETIIYIPSIVLAEALSIFEKQRVNFDFRKLFKMMQGAENFSVIPLDFHILQKMLDLKEVVELHDKIIVSTAKFLRVPLITKDKVLHNISAVKAVW
jgi:PIN domain nuclease of toxin-antitoxin system